MTAFNSYYDRDVGPVGGLEQPPPVAESLLAFSLAVQAIGFALCCFVNATVARNSVDANGASAFSGGGGLYRNSGTTTLQATIIALNTSPTGLGPDCLGPPASDGHNLIGDTTDCSFTPKGNDKHDVNPKLAKLAANGGPTQTVALLKGSPAIDWIPKKSCAVTTDQRGVSRPQGPRCDIGSYERNV